MFEKIRYVNHINEELKFGSGPLYVDSNDLHDFTWTIVSKNDRISGFKKGVVKKTIPVILKCDAGSGAAWRNTVFEICEKDILAQKPGRLFVGNYYLKCYITASVKKDYLTSESYRGRIYSVCGDFPAGGNHIAARLSVIYEKTGEIMQKERK